MRLSSGAGTPWKARASALVVVALVSGCLSGAPTVREVKATTHDVADLEQAFAVYSGWLGNTSYISGLQPSYPRIVYFAPTKTYWAVAVFLPVPNLAADVAADFAPPENTQIFSRTPTTAWTEQASGSTPFPCPTVVVPDEVWPAWGLPLLPPSRCRNVFVPPSPR